jgi:hypothetical protein
MHAIEVEQMCRTSCIAADFVHVDQLHFWMPPQSPSRQAPHAAKAIDCDFDCHGMDCKSGENAGQCGIGCKCDGFVTWRMPMEMRFAIPIFIVLEQQCAEVDTKGLKISSPY